MTKLNVEATKDFLRAMAACTWTAMPRNAGFDDAPEGALFCVDASPMAVALGESFGLPIGAEPYASQAVMGDGVIEVLVVNEATGEDACVMINLAVQLEGF